MPWSRALWSTRAATSRRTRVDGARPRVEAHGLAEGEEVAHQAVQAADLGLHVGQDAVEVGPPSLVLGGEPLAHVVDREVDEVQRVADLVGHAPRPGGPGPSSARRSAGAPRARGSPQALDHLVEGPRQARRSRRCPSRARATERSPAATRSRGLGQVPQRPAERRRRGRARAASRGRTPPAWRRGG